MLVDYHSCRVYLVEAGELVPAAVAGNEASEIAALGELRVALGQGITGHVAETGRSILLANSLDCEYALTIPGTNEVDESVIAVPLRYESRVNGVIFLSKLGNDQFDENDVRLLEVLASYAAVALENAWLYESLRREAAHTRAWLEFSDSLSSAGSVEAMTETIVDTVARLLEVDQCSLWLEDECEGDYICESSHGYLGEETSAQIAQVRIGEQAADDFIRSRKMPFLMTEQELHDWFFADIEPARLRPVATAPLPAGRGVKGWITVRAPAAGLSHFTEERLRLLDGLAYRASMALQKAVLYREQQENALVANALLEFGREVAPAKTEAEALSRASELVARMLDAPRAYVLLEDDSGDVTIGASYGTDESTRELRFPGDMMRELLDGEEAFVLSGDAVREMLSGAGMGVSREPAPLVVSPLVLAGGRLGCIVAPGTDPEHEFSELDLRLIEGMARQAALLISR
jgi:GAF domain-containing protein